MKQFSIHGVAATLIAALVACGEGASVKVTSPDRETGGAMAAGTSNSSAGADHTPAVSGESGTGGAASSEDTSDAGSAAQERAGAPSEGGSSGTPNPSAGTSGVQDPLFAAPRCSSALFWDPNESEGLDMMPGHACITCHAESNAASGENDAPIFAFAGTVFPSGHEPDNCAGSGAEGAVVVVTDATGAVFTATIGHTGNFSFENEAFAYPLRAKVTFNGRERAMTTPQVTGDCNHCHTDTGLEAAPGRIVLP